MVSMLCAHRYTQFCLKVVIPEIVIQCHACLERSRREQVTFESSPMEHVAPFETSRLFRTCKLDLPGFKNLEGLHIGLFLA
ncbi:MAG TPA: hypothetical protein VIF37_13625 [Methylobacter sp.]|jgi:hypothetical protein